MARLNIRVLGPFRATLDGTSLGLESNKVRALLIYLAMESGYPHSREVLAEMFWPDQPQRLAMSNLRFALADLRSNIKEKAGRPQFLIITHDTVQFHPCGDAWLDAVQLKAIADAQDPPGLASIAHLELAALNYNRSFLEGFSVRHAEPFEEWMLTQREQLASCFRKVLRALTDYYETQGRFEQALRFARQRLDTDPLDEEAHQQIMRLLAFDGQRCAALAQYETCEAVLRRELNIAPSKQTTALYESIRDGTLSVPLHFNGSAAAPHRASEPDAPSVDHEQSAPQPDGTDELRLIGVPMRIAVISDIHGNCIALDAALADLKQHPADHIVCLGDAIQGGPQPAEVVSRLRELGCAVVMGNADAWLLSGVETGNEPTSEERQRMLDAVREWSLARLSAEDRTFIQGFRPTVEMTLEAGRRLLCFHGSPASFDDIMLPDTPQAELSRFLGEYHADVLTGGHTHVQYIRRLGADGRFFFNPGSIGFAYSHHQPDDAFRADAWAEYAVLTSEGERLALEFRRVPYDVAPLMEAYQSSGRPYAEQAIAQYSSR